MFKSKSLKFIAISLMLSSCVVNANNNVKSDHLGYTDYNPKGEYVFNTEEEFNQFVTNVFKEHKDFLENNIIQSPVNISLNFKKENKGYFSSANVIKGKLFYYTKNMKGLMNSYNSYDYSLNKLKKIKETMQLNKFQQKLLNHAISIVEKPIVPYTKEEQKIIFEFYVAHELGHLYFFNNRLKPNYHPLFSKLYLNKNGQEIRMMRDELYADFIALILMKQKYGNNADFLSAMEKHRKNRIVSSVASAIEYNSNYNLYPLYENNLSSIWKYQLHNETDLEQISKQVDKWIMEIIYKYGLNHFEENIEKYAEDIFNNINIDFKNCTEWYNNSGTYLDLCLNDYNLSTTVKNSVKTEEDKIEAVKILKKLIQDIKTYQKNN